MSRPERRVQADASRPPGRIERTEAQWRERLPEEAFRVARKKGTERPFTGAYWDHHDPGVYLCVCCGVPLFSSETKFESGTGWPSFADVIDPELVGTEEDRSLFMRRTEAVCRVCDAHLGHVFPDGPEPTGLRYCINSAALSFRPESASESEPEPKAKVDGG